MPDADIPVNSPQPPPASDNVLVCPECAGRFSPDDIDTHLRRIHRIYRFRGVRRSLPDTFSTLVNLLSSPADTPEAWLLLDTIAREEYGPQADAFLASSVIQALLRVGTSDAAIGALVAAIVAGSDAARLLPPLTAASEGIARYLAVRVAAQLPPPLERSILIAVCSLLSDRRLSPEVTVATAAALVQTTGKEGPSAAKVFQSLVEGWGNSRGIERLRWLEQRIGFSATLNAIRSQLEDRQRLSCPRCKIEMRRPGMIEHLWNEHRLVLDGRRVREPWSAIEHWVNDLVGAAPPEKPELLARCRALAQKTDGEEGLARLNRWLLARGLGDNETRQALLAEAAALHVSLCPHCFGRVPVPLQTPPRSLNVWHGRISAFGYRIEVGDRGLFTRLEIETPTATPRRGPEPEKVLTYSGAMLFIAGPPVLLATLLSLGLVVPTLPPLIPVLLLLMGSVVAAWYVKVTSRQKRSALDRAVDYAWEEVASRLHEAGFSREDSAFAAALAWTSLGRGQPGVRAKMLDRLVTLTDNAVASGNVPLEHLADLRRLAIDDAAAEGRDPVPLVVAEMTECVEGKRPLSYVERLLAGWESDWWTNANLARTRVLICDRAFEAGCEVATLREAGQAAPTFGAVLETEDPDGLARLRLLWSLRSRRPWDRCGPSQTVFDVAEQPELASHLEEYPDLLLLQEPPDGQLPVQEGDQLPVVICGRGVVFQGTLFETMPKMLEVVELGGVLDRGFDVVLDKKSFWLRRDPEKLTERLERWFRFFFQEFAPHVAEVHGWRSPGAAATLRALEAVSCPDCGRPVLPRAGQVGGALESEPPG
jgi:hypothetical protein